VNTRETLVAAALKVLEQDGEAQFSTRAVCAIANVTAPTLYHHFGNADGLLSAAMAEVFVQFLESKKAAAAAVQGMNMNRQGQSCSSTSRVFVHAALHDEVVAELVRRAEALAIGFPWLEHNEVGPIVSERQFERIMGYIDSARSEGAELLTGGGRPNDPSLRQGFFIAPTVFDHVTPAMRIAREPSRNGHRSRPATIVHSTFLGNCVHVDTRLSDGEPAVVEISRLGETFAPGEQVHLWWEPADELRF